MAVCFKQDSESGSSGLELHINIRVKVFEQGNSVVINRDQDGEEEMKDAVPPNQDLEKKDDKERLLYDPAIVKELGVYDKPITYEDYECLQLALEMEQQARLVNDFRFDRQLFENTRSYSMNDYKQCFDRLYEESLKQNSSARKSARKNTQKYETKMPEFYTVKRLGRGDFGKAYLIVKANDQSLFEYERAYADNKNNNLYALKMVGFPKKEHLNHSLKIALHNELNFNHTLFHPNICKFFGAYSTNFFCAFIHEYLCCGSVECIIADMECFTNRIDLYKKRMLFYSSQLLLALDYLHKQHIYHGDVKEDNICLDYRGYAKLIDFGNAEVAKIQPWNGTVKYIAEIHIQGKKGIDRNTNLSEYFLNLLRWYNSGHQYEIDIFNVSIFFQNFFEDYSNWDEALNGAYNHPDEIDLVYKCADLCSAKDRIPVPTATELIHSHLYYKKMDFTKLLLRGFDLGQELDIDLAKLFEKYTQNHNHQTDDSKSDSDTESEAGRVFTENEMLEFHVKNDIQRLEKTIPKNLFNVFAVLSQESFV